jgi:hypothetical protein
LSCAGGDQAKVSEAYGASEQNQTLPNERLLRAMSGHSATAWQTGQIDAELVK